MFWALCGSQVSFHPCFPNITLWILRYNAYKTRVYAHFVGGVTRCSHLLCCLTNVWDINWTLSSSVAVRIRNSVASHIFLAHNVTSNIHKNNSVFAWWWWWWRWCQDILFVGLFRCDERKTEDLVLVLNEEPRDEIADVQVKIKGFLNFKITVAEGWGSTPICSAATKAGRSNLWMLGWVGTRNTLDALKRIGSLVVVRNRNWISGFSSP